jgi:N-methylhydantoinase B
MSSTNETGLDLYTQEIIQNALIAAGEEMFGALRRSSMSPIIYESLDYSVGLTDGKGELIAQGQGTTVFLGMMDSLVKEIIERYGLDNIHPGDVFISNDPYGGGSTHLSDVGLVTPIFDGELLVAWAINKAHWVDVGGMQPGSMTTASTEIYQEGLQLPYIRLISKGEPQQAVLDILAANIRHPKQSLGDMWAGVAANRVGEKRILGLIAKYGQKAVLAGMDDLLDYGERMAMAELRKLPKGVFECTDHIDSDGQRPPTEVHVKITITDDEFIADFSKAPPTLPGSINCSWHGLVAACRIIFKAMTNPAVPANSGTFRPLRVICPPNTCFTVTKPAATSTYWETMLYADDLIWKAMAELVPQRLTAGHVLSVCATTIETIHPKTGEATLGVQPMVGGWGAAQDADGLNGQFSIADGETYNIPVEIQEFRNGLHVEQYSFHSEDGGAGEFIGGRGSYLEYTAREHPVYISGSYGRHDFPPWGVKGGQNGSGNYIQVIRKDGSEEKHLSAARLLLNVGDRARCVTSSGAGWGEPGKRNDDALRDDLRNGFFTPEQVSKTFGRPDIAAEFA